MPERFAVRQPPRGISRAAYRFPIWLYRLGLGWIFGKRFLLLTHTGRSSGLPRQVVLEIVRYDNRDGSCIVASGWGEKSDWFQNVQKTPRVELQVGSRRIAAIAERLPAEVAEHELLAYARKHPQVLQALARFMGYRLDGTEEDVRAFARLIPILSIKPIQGES